MTKLPKSELYLHIGSCMYSHDSRLRSSHDFKMTSNWPQCDAMSSSRRHLWRHYFVMCLLGRIVIISCMAMPKQNTNSDLCAYSKMSLHGLHKSQSAFLSYGSLLFHFNYSTNTNMCNQSVLQRCPLWGYWTRLQVRLVPTWLLWWRRQMRENSDL